MLSRAKIKIIVVPVQIDGSSFLQYYSLLNQNSTVALGESTSKYEQFNRKVYLDFILESNGEDLQDLELQYQVFGIVGLMNCQEDKLTEGFKKFSKITEKVFGFN
jgi:hypothetical protein